MLTPADVMVVLGRVDDQGHLTNDARERIRYAAELYKKGLVSEIIAPARWSYRLKHVPSTTEAALIKSGLIGHGVPESAIQLEEQSCDTLGAAYYSKVDFVLKRGWKKIIVITSEDHLERTKYTFHKVYGDGFNIQYACGNRVLSSQDYRRSIEREKRSLRLMDSTWVGPIVPGEHKMVEAVFAIHPGYNAQAVTSPQEIERRIQAQPVS